MARELRSLDFDHPVSSLALCADGKTLAVGTTRGEILIYDLRGAITPLYSTHAHDDAEVNSLQFATSSAESSAASVSPHGVPVVSREYHPQQLRTAGASSPPPSTGRATGETLQEIATRKLEALGIGSAVASPPHSPTNAHSLVQQTTTSPASVGPTSPGKHGARSASPEPSLLSRISPSRSRSSTFGCPPFLEPSVLGGDTELAQSSSRPKSVGAVTQRQDREYWEKHDIRERIRFVRHELEVQHRTTFDYISDVLEELLCSNESLVTENAQLRRENDQLKIRVSSSGE